MSAPIRAGRDSNTICPICGIGFFRWPYEIKQGLQICCSHTCGYKYKQQKAEQRRSVNTVCANCGKLFYRAQKRKKSKSNLYFCSVKCQNDGYRKHTILTGPKPTVRPPGLTKKEYTHCKLTSLGRRCANCGGIIFNNNKSGYCIHCVPRYNASKLTVESRKILSNKSKKLMEDGIIKPWQSRNVMSYPEKFFKKVLDLNHIEYDGINYPVKQADIGVPNCNPHACYFLDFKIGNIDLEIDGKQHKYADRAAADKVRDACLTKAGYHVYRIKWMSINTVEGKQYMKQEIDKFLTFYRNNKV